MTTQQKLIASRKYAIKWYHKNKHTESYKANRRKRQGNYLQRHTFKRLLKALNKHDYCNLKPFDLWKIAKKQKLICPLTGHKLSNENISPDHIIHLSNGGGTTIDNIRFVTKAANIARHTLSDTEFIQLCKDIVIYATRRTG